LAHVAAARVVATLLPGEAGVARALGRNSARGPESESRGSSLQRAADCRATVERNPVGLAAALLWTLRAGLLDVRYSWVAAGSVAVRLAGVVAVGVARHLARLTFLPPHQSEAIKHRFDALPAVTWRRRFRLADLLALLLGHALAPTHLATPARLALGSFTSSTWACDRPTIAVVQWPARTACYRSAAATWLVPHGDPMRRSSRRVERQHVPAKAG
jgi:hypothetical protein